MFAMETVWTVIYGCSGSSLPYAGFVCLWQVGATLPCEAQIAVFHGARARAQQLWHMGLAAPPLVESSWITDRTGVPCTGRCQQGSLWPFLLITELNQ